MTTFICPRCENEVDDDFYGPCGSCRSALRSSVGHAPRAMDVEAYEPKSNVTPNAVAQKED